jgi:hypothetical protein
MRVWSLWGFGASLACAAFLTACGGGGGSTPGGGLGSAGHASTSHGAGTTLTLVIHRGAKFSKANLTPIHGKALARRTPKYISSEAEGLQIAVAGTGVASQTIYADISNSSPLCTTNGSTETCTLAVPTIAASEQFAILETDNTPQNESNGYGTGFTSGTNVLGAINQAETVQIGTANALAIEISPVAAQFYDVSDYNTPPALLPQTFSTNYGIDCSGIDGTYLSTNVASRIVVTQGVAATGSILPLPCDAEEEVAGTGDTTPALFVDVNASPAPITLTSNSSNVGVAPIINGGTAPGPSSYTQTGSIPNDGYLWYVNGSYPYPIVGVKSSSSLTSFATITVANNLAATTPFSTGPYTSTMVYTIVPISASSYSLSVAASGTTTVTGSDYGAANGMDAESAYGQYDYNCNNSSGTTLATISTGSIDTTTWQQSFTVNAGATTGTCTFYLTDDYAETVTKPITVTVN